MSWTSSLLQTGALKTLERDVGEKKKGVLSPEWGALGYHRNRSDVRACIM